MKVTWLGQAGLYIEANGTKILVDPYFSDSVAKVEPQNQRRMPKPPRELAIEPDVLIFTHDHLDHYDPETAPVLLKSKQPMLVLCPMSCWNKTRANGGGHNYILFNCGTQWTERRVRFTAVPAAHSDPYAIGVVLDDGRKRLYITGDTLYSENIFPALPDGLDAVFLPINGRGNNMNAKDASRFARDCGAKLAVPIHWGMFDDIDPNSFPFEPKKIPEIYTQMQF